MLINLPLVENHKPTNPIEKYRFVHNFIPHPYHRTRARLLSQKALAFYSMLLLFTMATFKLVPLVMPGVLGYASNIKVEELLKLTNKIRVDAGLNSLALNDELTKAAQKKAEDMFKNNYWSHVSPKGTQPWDFILAQSYDYSFAGENLAKNFNTSRDVVDAWYNSPSHKENLVSKNYEEIGFAVVNGVLDGYKTTLVVQMFGKQRNPTHLASAEEQKKIVENIAKESANTNLNTQPSQTVQLPSSYSVGEEQGSVLPAVDVAKASKMVSVVFGGFVGSLLSLDYWYSKRKGIPKFSGHTMAHLAFLLMAIVGIWFVIAPGRIL